MILCSWILPLPIHLNLPDNSHFFIKTEERNVYLLFESIYGEKIISYNTKNYSWLDDSLPVEENPVVEQIRVLKNENDKKAVFRQWYFVKNRLPSVIGIVDQNTFSVIHLVFEVENIESLENETLELTKNWVGKVLSKFIDTYRMFSSDTDVVKFPINEIPCVEILTADQYYSFDKEGFEGNLRPFKRIYNWMNAESLGHLKEEFTQTNLEIIRKRLEENIEVPIYNELLLDARELSHNYKKHDLAIVVIENAFETFLQKKLIFICQNRNITQLEYGRGKGATLIDYIEAIEKGGVKEYLLPYVVSLSNHNVKGGIEYNNWLTKTYERRNDIVHKGFRGATTTDAGEAFKSTIDFINFINKHLT